MMLELVAQVAGPWRQALRQAGVVPRPPLAAMKLSGRARLPGVTTYLLFGTGARQPDLVVQVAERPIGQRRLENAHRTLTELAAIPALQGTLPRPVGLFDVDDALVLVLTALVGTSLDLLLRRGTRARLDQVQYDLFRAQVWLQLMHEATAAGALLFEGRTAVIERLALLSHLGVAPGAALRAWAGELAEVADDFRGLPLPLTGRHGNFDPASILIDHSRLGVIGWGEFSYSMTPFEDVFRLPVGLAEAYPGPGRAPLAPEAAFQRAFLSENRFSALILEYVDRYLRAMHLPPASAHLFFGLFLMDQALAEQSALRRREIQGSLWLPRLVLYADHSAQAIFRRSAGAAEAGEAAAVPRAA